MRFIKAGLTLILFSISLATLGQADTFKIYGAKLSCTETSVDGVFKEGEYRIDDKIVSKELYKKIEEANKVSGSGKTVYCKSYTMDGVLLWEGLKNGDCVTGQLIQYYPTGKKKLVSSWVDCMKQTGLWTYFKENGDTLKVEQWDNGEFIKEYPEQAMNEVWKFDISIGNIQLKDAESLAPDSINQVPLDSIKQFKIIPFFKNKSDKGIDMVVTITSGDSLKEAIPFDGLPNYKIERFIKDNALKPGDYLMIGIMNNPQSFGKNIGILIL